MQFQFDVTPQTEIPSAPPLEPGPEAVNLLRQILDIQREQLTLLRTSTAAHDAGARLRAFLSRWQQDFPDLPQACRHALPVLERAYVSLIADLANHLRHEDAGDLENEFTLGDFLDRYGMRLGQLGSILSLVGPLAEAANSPGEAT